MFELSGRTRKLTSRKTVNPRQRNIVVNMNHASYLTFSNIPVDKNRGCRRYWERLTLIPRRKDEHSQNIRRIRCHSEGSIACDKGLKVDRYWSVLFCKRGSFVIRHMFTLARYQTNIYNKYILSEHGVKIKWAWC